MSVYPYLYHSTECDAVNSNGYTEFDTLDFTLDFSGRALVCGTLRVEADLRCRSAGTSDWLPDDRVACDNMVGGHAFFQSVVSSTLSQGVIENVTNLPRLVKMKTAATETADDMNNSKYVCELRSSDKKVQEKLMKRRCISDYGGGDVTNSRQQDDGKCHNGSGEIESVPVQATAPDIGNPLVGHPNFTLAATPQMFPLPDFSIKPHICFNNPVGNNRLLNYSTTGTIRISLNLARVAEALHGEDLLSTSDYVLTNVRMCYTSVPEPPQQMPISLRTNLCLKSALNSQLSNTSNRVPAVCDSVSMSFMRLSHENHVNHNNTALELVPNVDRLQFMFNDSTSKYIAYELKKGPEIVAEGLKALSVGTMSNNVRLDTLAANKGYIAGLAFGDAVDLSQQKFNVQIESGISSDNPYTMYCYFGSIMSF